MVYKIEERYEWRGIQYPVEPQVAGAHFKRLEEQFGQVTPENLLESSRPEEAVMHKCFEWDDSVAAERYRKQQAYSMISNLIKVVIRHESKPEPSSEIKTRAVVNVSSDRGKGRFVSVERAMSDGEMHEIVLRNAIRELEEFKAKYRNLRELKEVFEALRVVKERVMEVAAG